MKTKLIYASLLVLISLLISGCPPRVAMQSDLQSSKTKYKDCLIAYPHDASQCDTLRKLYEVDKDAVEALGEGRNKGVILLNK